jgi:hypothetical protein
MMLRFAALLIQLREMVRNLQVKEREDSLSEPARIRDCLLNRV